MTRKTSPVSSGSDPVILTSTLTCPSCGRQSPEEMPEDRCVVRFRCPACGTDLRPEAGDCCVFCSYGTRPCPPHQRAER